MSWDQGVQERSTMTPGFIAFAEKKAREHGIETPLEYITWFGSDPKTVICDFGDRALTIQFK